ELVAILKNSNPWWHRTALRLLAERKDSHIASELESLALSSDNDTHGLRGLWALYASGLLDDALAERLLRHQSPWVRSWTVRLLGDGGKVSTSLVEHFAKLAAEDKSVDVRLQLASTVQRLNSQEALQVLHALMARAEDADDPCIPLMIWLAYE